MECGEASERATRHERKTSDAQVARQMLGGLRVTRSEMEWQGFEIWEYAGVAEQCPRFASPDRISEVLGINTVLAKKLDPLLVRINILGARLFRRKQWPF